MLLDPGEKSLTNVFPPPLLGQLTRIIELFTQDPKKPILDPGIKKAQNPGSGSAILSLSSTIGLSHRGLPDLLFIILFVLFLATKFSLFVISRNDVQVQYLIKTE